MAIQGSLVLVLGSIVLVSLYFQASGDFASNVSDPIGGNSFPEDFVFGTASSAYPYPYEGAPFVDGEDTNNGYPAATVPVIPEGRSSFPEGFIFGTASSAYQYEGAAFVGGKGRSNWDYFTHAYPGKIKDRSNGDVAVDSYHRFKEDVSIMKQIGMDAYRVSISWSRLLPRGRLSGGVNEDGIKYYNDLINELLSNDIQPFVTLFHWDFPQALDEEYGGFLNSKVIDDYRNYTDLCFREFGDRVKHWITFNEPQAYSASGYATGVLAPGRCSLEVDADCIPGNSGTEPYWVTHHQLLAHAAAVKLYREKYQTFQKGKIGITLSSHWVVPYSRSQSDIAAAGRALDFVFGWFMNPLTYGEYPESMQALVGYRLPQFSKEQSLMVKGSLDFLGLNYYTSIYARNVLLDNTSYKSYTTDYRAKLTYSRNGILIGPETGSGLFCVYPRGLRELLIHTKKKYRNPIIFITENGYDDLNNSTLPVQEALKDYKRIAFYQRHLSYLRLTMKDGVDVRGYFTWSLLDNFEWNSGYTIRFGIIYIDYNDGLKRYKKWSAIWFEKFLKN